MPGAAPRPAGLAELGWLVGTWEGDGPDGMVGAVRIENPDGTSREAVFRYRRISAR